MDTEPADAPDSAGGLEDDVLGVAAEAQDDEDEPLPEWARDDVEPSGPGLLAAAEIAAAAAPSSPPGSFTPSPGVGGTASAAAPSKPKQVDPDKAKAVEELKAAILKAAAKPAVLKPETEALLTLCGCVRKLAEEQPLFKDVSEVLPKLGEACLAPLMGIRRPVKKVVPEVEAVPAAANEVRVTGRVKSYNSRKGFGFIDVPGYSRDIFVYNAHLIGRIGLVTGEAVSFTLCFDGGRPQARQVRPESSGIVPTDQQVQEPANMTATNPLSAMKQGMAMAQTQASSAAPSMQELALAMAAASPDKPATAPARPPKPQREEPNIFDQIQQAQAKAQAAHAQAAAEKKQHKKGRDRKEKRSTENPPGNFDNRFGGNQGYQVSPPQHGKGGGKADGFSDQGRIPRNTTVRITNFPAAEVNNCLGVVQGYDAATERYSVSVSIGEGSSETVPLQLKAEFLKVESQPQQGKGSHMSMFDAAARQPVSGPGQWLGAAPMGPGAVAVRPAAMMGPLQPAFPGYVVGVRPGGAPMAGPVPGSAVAVAAAASGASTAGNDLAAYAQSAAAMRSFLSGVGSGPASGQPAPRPGVMPVQPRQAQGPNALQQIMAAGAAHQQAGIPGMPGGKGPADGKGGGQQPAGGAGTRPTVDSAGRMIAPAVPPPAVAAPSASRQKVGQPPPEGHPGQLWRVLTSKDFVDVIIRQTQDVTSKELRRLRPGEVCMQRGQTVALQTGLVRMPILPDGWVTLHARYVGGPTFFEETTMTQSAMPGAINEADFAKAAEKAAAEKDKGGRKKDKVEPKEPKMSAKDAETFGDHTDLLEPWKQGADGIKAARGEKQQQAAPETQREKRNRRKGDAANGPSYSKNWLLSSMDVLVKAGRLEKPEPSMAGFRTFEFPREDKDRDRDRDRDRRRERRSERAAAEGEDAEEGDRDRRRERRDEDGEERDRPRRRDRQRRRELAAEEARAAEEERRREDRAREESKKSGAEPAEDGAVGSKPAPAEAAPEGAAEAAPPLAASELPAPAAAGEGAAAAPAAAGAASAADAAAPAATAEKKGGNNSCPSQ